MADRGGTENEKELTAKQRKNRRKREAAKRNKQEQKVCYSEPRKKVNNIVNKSIFLLFRSQRKWSPRQNLKI